MELVQAQDNAFGGLKERLIQIRDNARPGQEPNLTSVANAAGLNRVVVSGIANGRLEPTQDQVERLWKAMDALCGESTEPQRIGMPGQYKQQIEIFETEQFRGGMGFLGMIQARRKMGVMVGHPGSGKTTILKDFCRRTGARYIECWSMMRMGDLLAEIGRTVGINPTGNMYQRTMQLEKALSNRDDVMLVMDEAEQLRKWDVDKFELLRKLCENSRTPLMLAGTMQLATLLTRGGGRDNLAQLYRRQWAFELRGIQDAEVRAILRSYNVTAAAAAELIRIATDVQHGGMGNFVEVLELCLEAANGDRIDEQILSGAKKYKLMF